MDIPDELVEKLNSLKIEFPDIFLDTDYVNIKWNVKENIFMVTITKNNTQVIVIK